MRKFSKVVLVIAAAAGVVGIGLTIGGASMGATIAGLNLSKGGFGSAVRQDCKICKCWGVKMTGIRTGMRLMNRTVKRQPERTGKSI